MRRKQARTRGDAVLPLGAPERALEHLPIPSSEDLGVEEGRYDWSQRGHIGWIRDAALSRARALALADDALRVAVLSARRAGLSWADVGLAVGVSKQAASMRWGRG